MLPTRTENRLVAADRELEDRVHRLELTIDRHGMLLGRSPLFRGSTWEVSDYHIAQWTPGSSLPLTDSSKYVRFYKGNLEIRGGALDIQTAADGARMKMTGDYLKTWDASENQTFYLDFTTGNLLMTGTFYVPGKYRLDSSGIHVEVADEGNYIDFIGDVDSSPLGHTYGYLVQRLNADYSSLTIASIASSAAGATYTKASLSLNAIGNDYSIGMSLNSYEKEIQFSISDSVDTSHVLTLTDTSTVFNDLGADIDFRVESDNNANMLFVDGGEDRVGIGTASPQATLDVAGTVEVRGQINHPLTAGGVIRACFVKATIADNTPTGVFTITCTNETGDADAGGYSCYIRGHAQHTGKATSVSVASMSTEAKFNRSVLNTGEGTNSAVAASSSASSATAAWQRDIATFDITVTETSEYINTVNATVDLSGSNLGNAFVVLEVTLLWYAFTTPPVLEAV